MAISSDPVVLRTGLRLSVDALRRRRADEISERLVEELVACDWLEWHGGTLRLTTTGENIYRRELAQINAANNLGALERSATSQGQRH